jgi:hypothetical protein
MLAMPPLSGGATKADSFADPLNVLSDAIQRIRKMNSKSVSTSSDNKDIRKQNRQQHQPEADGVTCILKILEHLLCSLTIWNNLILWSPSLLRTDDSIHNEKRLRNQHIVESFQQAVCAYAMDAVTSTSNNAVNVSDQQQRIALATLLVSGMVGDFEETVAKIFAPSNNSSTDDPNKNDSTVVVLLLQQWQQELLRYITETICAVLSSSDSDADSVSFNQDFSDGDEAVWPPTNARQALLCLNRALPTLYCNPQQSQSATIQQNSHHLLCNNIVFEALRAHFGRQSLVSARQGTIQLQVLKAMLYSVRNHNHHNHEVCCWYQLHSTEHEKDQELLSQLQEMNIIAQTWPQVAGSTRRYRTLLNSDTN